MMDVKCISKTEKPNGNLTDISIDNGIKCLAFHLTGLDVYPTMKMIGAWLGKVAGQLYIIMDWRPKYDLRYHEKTQQQTQINKP